MTSSLLIVQIVLAIAITITVLLQKSSSIGLGAYSGSNESVFGAKGPTGFLAKLTFTLALLLIVNTLTLGYLYTKENSHSVADSIVATPQSNTLPSVPTVTSDEQNDTTVPVAPQAPESVNFVETTPKSASPAVAETNNSVAMTTEMNTTSETNSTTSEVPAQ